MALIDKFPVKGVGHSGENQTRFK
ncbi:putative AC9 transposase, partial [Fusarium oxysporum f. sp. albedinis]